MRDVTEEILIQKCVDGELTAQERSELLSKLEARGALNDWRTLALSFVENQVLGQAFRAVDSVPPRVRAAVIETPRRTRARWLGQLTSVAAALCLGMLSGVGAHFWLNRGDAPAPSQAPLLVRGEQAAPPNAVSAGGLTQQPSSPVPVMNVRLTGLGNSSTEPMSVPVYSPEQWQTLPQAYRSTGLPDDVRRFLESQGMAVDREQQWYRAPLQDGREILVPMETVRVRQAVQ